MIINVIVQPWAKQEKIEIQKWLLWDDIYKVRLRAKPIDGEANEALISALAEHFKTIKKNINIVSWWNSRMKRIEILN